MASFNHQVLTMANCPVYGFRDAPPMTCRHGRNRRTKPDGCGRPCTHVCMYDYVTGRAGRVTDARRPKCEEHAQLFATRHNTPMPHQVAQSSG